MELAKSFLEADEATARANTVGHDLRRAPLLWFLFHHRQTIEMLASTEDAIDPDSFLHVLEPYEKKQQRVHARMSERRTCIPEDRPKLKLTVRRGDELIGDLLQVLAVTRDEGTPAVESSGGGAVQERDRDSAAGAGLRRGFSSSGGGGDAEASRLPLCRKLEVSYKDEPGEGIGMTRMVVTDVAKALRAGTGAAVGLFMPSPLVTAAGGSEEGSGGSKWWEKEPMGRVVPAPPSELARAGTPAPSSGGGEQGTGDTEEQRASRMRGIGNVLGLCLLHGVKFPLFFCRHVYKFLLGRKVNYADYAYYDPQNHHTLLLYVRDSASMSPDTDMMLSWDESVGFGEEGDDAPAVTPQNVHAYVLRKAHFEMVERVSRELGWLKEGLHDVIAPADLSDLTAEDLQLLLSGRGGAISVKELTQAISFVDAREEAIRLSEPTRLAAFSKNFLLALESMTEEERLEVVEYATGSMTRPERLVVRLTDIASDKGSIDEISAHACINDMSVPDFRTDDASGTGTGGVISPLDLKLLLLNTVKLSKIIGTTFA